MYESATAWGSRKGGIVSSGWVEFAKELPKHVERLQCPENQRRLHRAQEGHFIKLNLCRDRELWKRDGVISCVTRLYLCWGDYR